MCLRAAHREFAPFFFSLRFSETVLKFPLPPPKVRKATEKLKIEAKSPLRRQTSSNFNLREGNWSIEYGRVVSETETLTSNFDGSRNSSWRRRWRQEGSHGNRSSARLRATCSHVERGLAAFLTRGWRFPFRLALWCVPGLVGLANLVMVRHFNLLKR